MAALTRLADLTLGPAVIIPAREPEPADAKRLDLTAIGLAIGLALYGLIGAALAGLSLAHLYGVM